MKLLSNTHELLKEVGVNRERTGTASDVASDGPVMVEVTVSKGSEGYRTGSWTVAFELDDDESPEDIMRGDSDIPHRLNSTAKQLQQLVNENVGYNPYEPVAEKPRQGGYMGQFDILLSDSFTVFDTEDGNAPNEDSE